MTDERGGSGVNVTDGDRERAMQLMAWDPLDYETFANAVNNGRHPDDLDALETVDAIAAALAEERQKARAPFLALAEEYAERSDSVKDRYWARSLWIFSQRIRSAAEVTE